jgi:hypothetical protein
MVQMSKEQSKMMQRIGKVMDQEMSPANKRGSAGGGGGGKKAKCSNDTKVRTKSTNRFYDKKDVCEKMKVKDSDAIVSVATKMLSGGSDESLEAIVVDSKTYNAINLEKCSEDAVSAPRKRMQTNEQTFLKT